MGQLNDVATRQRMGVAGRALIIAAAAIVAFGPALHGAWLWDDGLEVADNPLVRAADGWWKPWVAPAGMDYFPLKSSLQWVQWHLWGDQVVGYHVSNLALHVVSAWLLWRVLAKLGVRLAWIGGLWFAVHPMAVESVAWIAEFKNVVALPPLLLAWDAWIGSDGVRGSSQLRALGWFAIAILCKSSVVMFPVALLVFVWWRDGRIGRKDVIRTAPFFLLALVLGLVTLWFQWHRAMGRSPETQDWAARWGQAGWCILAYARNLVVPVDLAPVYGPTYTGLPVVPWLVVAAVLAVGWRYRRGWGRSLLFGSGWFLLNLVPVIGVIPIAYLRVGPRADHLAYLALAGGVGGAAAVFSAAWERWAGGRGLSRAVLVSGAVAIVALLAAGSRAYASAFRSGEALWTLAVARQPQAWLARNNLGRVWLLEGQPEAALTEFTAAARLEPDSAEVRANRGDALDRLGRHAEALACFQEAVTLAPALAGARYDLGRALLVSGRPGEAAAQLQAAVRLDPGHAAAHNNLGLALARLGRPEDAIAEFRTALALDPARPEAHVNLGNAWFREGRVDEAANEYEAAVRLDPGYAAARRNLAVAREVLARARAASAGPAAAGP